MNLRENEALLQPLNPRNWVHCACVLSAVAAATLIRFPVQPVIHNASPFLFYFPVVVAMAIAFGPRFGLLATAASILPADYFWMAPERVFAVDLPEVCQILGFSFAGCTVSWLSETARKRKQLEEHLRATLACIGDGLLTVDCRGKVVYLNSMAQALTELHGPEVIGCTLGTVLNLVSESDHQPLSGAFQLAARNDRTDDLPRRLVVVSKTGRRHPVEQRSSRILDARGRRIGTAILFHRLQR